MAKIIRREWTSREMTKLGWRQFIQQLIAAELDEVSILRRERVPACQQGVNGFAGADEIRGLFPNRKQGGFSLRTGRQGVREGPRNPTRPRARPSVINVTLQEATTVTSRENGICGEEDPPFHLMDP